MSARRKNATLLIVLAIMALEAIIAWVWWPFTWTIDQTIRLRSFQLPRGFSADSRSFFTFYYDRNSGDSPSPEDFGIRVWDVETGRQRMQLPGAYGWQAHSRDGKLMAAAQRQADGSDVARVWDVITGTVILDLGPTGQFFAGEFLGDGKKLVQVKVAGDTPPGKYIVGHRYQACGFDPTRRDPPEYRARVEIWDLQAGRISHGFDLPEPFQFVEFGGDGTLIVLRKDGTVSLWDALTGDKRTTLPRPITQRGGIVLSPDCKVLARGDVLWDTGSGRELAQLDLPVGPDDQGVVIAFSPDSATLFVATTGFLRIFDAITRQERQAFPRVVFFTGAGAWYDNDVVEGLYMQPTPMGPAFAGSTQDGRILATEVWVEKRPANAHGKWQPRTDVSVWDADTGQELAHLNGAIQPFISPDGKLLATLEKGRIVFRKLPLCKPIAPFLTATMLLIFLCSLAWWVWNHSSFRVALRNNARSGAKKL